MNYFGRLVSGIKGYYSEINSATLTGAIDIIVVRQADGSFVGSPFHVRFGKIGVLRSREKVVDICINDEPVDLQMKLGEAGEAFFVEPCEEDVPHYLCTSPICDAESLMSEGLKKLKKEIKENEQEQFDSDSQHGSSVISTNGSAKELRDSDNDSFGDGDMAASQGNEDSKRTSLVQRSANISVPGKRINQRTIKNASHLHLNDFYPLSDLDSPLSTPDRQSPSNTDLSSPLRYSSDTEVNYQSELAASKDISSNQMTWNWGRLPQGLDAKPSPERKQLSEIKKEPKKQKHKSSSSLHKDMKQGMYLEDLLSVDQEVANLYLQQAGPHRKNSMPDQEDSDNVDAGVEATKSDVDITKNDEETTRTEEDTAGTEVDSFRKDEETAASDVDTFRNDGETAKSDSELNKSDGESGIGSSVSVSPDETKLLDSEPYSNIAISLCGELRRGKVSLERFLESVVPFEEFSKDPAQVLANPKLVVRIDDRYYNWNVAVPMLISHVVYQRPLPKSSVDALMKEHMPKKAKRRGYASWFSWRSPPEHNESTDEDNQEAERERWTKGDIGDLESEKTDGVMTEPLQQIPESNIEADMSSSGNENYKKVLELSSEQLASLNLKEGANEVSFSVTTKYQGTASCSASIFLYNYNDKIIISDIDGTITKSDVLGQILPATFWAQSGITKLFTSIQKNGYKFMYLSARPIGQAELTRQHLRNVVQENLSLPNGPLFLSPSSLIKAFHREVIEKKPEDFKIPCLRNIRKLFPPKNEPFFAGFGNRMNDVLSYRAVGIPVQRIFTVNHKGEVKNELTNAFQSSYTEMQELVDQMFPPCAGYTSLVASDEFSTFTYWRTPLTPLSDEQPLSNTLSAQDTETPS